MATTVTAPVTNSIALAAKYLPILDEIYTTESRTAILDTASERVQFTGANTVNLFTLETMGMGNYSRNAGFVPGDVNGSWVPYVLETDRGRSYMVDALDNDETLGMAFGALLSTVERQHVIPEVDAFRFAAYASGAAASQVVQATISTGAAAVAAVDAATVFKLEAAAHIAVFCAVAERIRNGIKAVCKVNLARFDLARITLFISPCKVAASFAPAGDKLRLAKSVILP